MMLEFALPSVAYIASLLTGLGIIILAVLALIQPRGRRKTIFIPFLFRLLVLLMLALILASPYTERPTFSGSVPALIDVSESMDTEKGEQLFQAIRSLQSPELPVSIYPFARKISSVPFSPTDFSSYEQLRAAFTALDPAASALSESIESLVGGQGGTQLLLASDGFETRGSVKERLALLQQKQVRIYPLLPGGNQNNQGFFRISQVHAPLAAAQLTTSQVRVTVENSTAEPRSGDLEILQGTTMLLKQGVRVTAGSEEVYVAQTLPAKGGIEKITARLVPKEKQYGESSRETFIAAEGREKILLISGSSQDSTYLGRVLENQAYQLENRVGGGALSGESLLNYSTIILNNISIEQLGRSNADGIVQAARAGKGVIMVGGDRSFGLGGYRGTVIEEALPVELLPPQREERRLNVAVMLVIDKSRSMDSDNKMDYAKEAARTFIANMKNDDYIGVIAFDASPFIVVRLGLLAEIRSMAADRIGRIFPTGSTRPLSAIDEARRSLVRVNAGRKHMLFLTDGQIEDAGPQYKELVKQMRLMGITSSTVMLGSETDGRFLKELADQGGGSYYQTNDARSLPRIFLSDVRVASGEQTMREQRNFRVTTSPDGHLRSTEISSYPDLLGYVETRIKPKANLELVATDGATAAPLLARWQYGAGNVVAYTSDANGRWSREWIEWSKYHQFWNDLLNSVRPESEAGQEKIPFDMRHFVENSKLVIEYALYSDDLSGNFMAQVKSPDGVLRDVAFRQVTPGRFRAEITDPMPGRYDIAGTLEKRKTAPVAFSLPPDGFREQQGLGFNMSLLDLIARTTGAVVNPSPEMLLRGLNKNTTREDRSALFIALAIIFSLLEIVFREILSRRAVRVVPGMTALVLLLSAVPAHASPRSEYYINQALDRYFQLPVDARTLSTSGSDALLCQGSVCNFLNPAGLGFTRRNEIAVTLADRSIGGDDFISENRIEQSEGRGYLAAAVPIGDLKDNAPEYGTFGLAYSRYHGDTDDEISTTPDGHRRTLAYGLAPFEKVAFGYSFTFYDDQLKSDFADLHSHARFLHLFGAQADLGDGYWLGALFQLGVGQSDTEDFNFKSDGLSHLKQYTSTVSLKKKWERISLSFAGDYTDLHSEGNLEQVSQPVVIGGTEEGFLFNLRSGIEAEMLENLFGRLGYRFFSGHYGFQRPELMELSGSLHGSGFGAGIGYAYDICEQTIKLDYGVEYVNVARNDWQHIVSLGWQF